MRTTNNITDNSVQSPEVKELFPSVLTYSKVTVFCGACGYNKRVPYYHANGFKCRNTACKYYNLPI